MLRVSIHQAEIPPGWLRVLADERLHPAVVRMHEDPGKPWRLETLAHAATMSRTSFATLFRAAAGMPPLAYRSRVRGQAVAAGADEPLLAQAVTLVHAHDAVTD